MGRIHLFELEDQAWFPDVIRDAGTAYLRFMAARAGQSAALAPKVAEILEELIRRFPKKQYWLQLSGVYGELEEPEITSEGRTGSHTSGSLEEAELKPCLSPTCLIQS